MVDVGNAFFGTPFLGHLFWDTFLGHLFWYVSFRMSIWGHFGDAFSLMLILGHLSGDTFLGTPFMVHFWEALGLEYL